MRFSPQTRFFSRSLLALDFQVPVLLWVFLSLSLLLLQGSMLPVQQTGLSELSLKGELPSRKKLFQAFQCTQLARCRSLGKTFLSQYRTFLD